MLPDPLDQPTMPLWPDTGKLLGLSRTSTYEAARKGQIPVLEFGRRRVVPTAALRRLLCIDEREDDSPGAASRLMTATDDTDRSRLDGNGRR